MLNPFPIQWLALFAYFILRVFVGGILIYLGFRHIAYRHELKHVLQLSWWPFGTFSVWLLVLVEFVAGILLLIGAFTQYTALVVMLMSLEFVIIRHWFDHHTIPPKIFYLLLLGASLSLFITGAGVLAFDLPL